MEKGKIMAALLSAAMLFALLSHVHVSFALTEGEFEYLIENNEAILTRYNGAGGTVNIPAELGGFPVTKINNTSSSFGPTKNIISVIMPDSVREIGPSVFSECTLESILLSDNLQMIGHRAFDGCRNLKEIIIPNSVTFIGEDVFASCTGLERVTLPNRIDRLGEEGSEGIPIRVGLFYACSSLTEITIPNSVTSIGRRVFFLCINLSKVVIPSSVTSIGPDAFKGIGAEEITIPASVNKIGDEAFGVFNHLYVKKAYFLGNPPAALGKDVFSSASDFSIYYASGQSGWTTPTWYKYKAEPFTGRAPNTYQLTVAGGSGGGYYIEGDRVSITAAEPQAGKVFDKWTAPSGVSFENVESKTTTITMPGNDITVTATYKEDPNLTYRLTVINGTGEGDYKPGQTVTITADAPPEGKVFDKWTASGGGTFENALLSTSGFTMPDADVTVMASYKEASYRLTVTGGTGGGDYQPGQTVTITADAPPEGKVFDKWVSSEGVIFADAAAEATSFIMPAKDVTAAAMYKDIATGKFKISDVVRILQYIAGMRTLDEAQLKMYDVNVDQKVNIADAVAILRAIAGA